MNFDLRPAIVVAHLALVAAPLLLVVVVHCGLNIKPIIKKKKIFEDTYFLKGPSLNVIMTDYGFNCILPNRK